MEFYKVPEYFPLFHYPKEEECNVCLLEEKKNHLTSFPCFALHDLTASDVLHGLRTLTARKSKGY